jgi:pimeloyl-ACP methyl ester carboxylesterase
MRLVAWPNFVTEIDGLDIHFIHVRSKHENALPLIVTHGWPGSIIEQLKIVDPLTNPTAYGASASDAFHLVIPSMPGYGFSGKPTTTGWDPARIARAWVVLMKRLGHEVRCTRRRLGRHYYRRNGYTGTSGTARYSFQHARRVFTRH